MKILKLEQKIRQTGRWDNPLRIMFIVPDGVVIYDMIIAIELAFTFVDVPTWYGYSSAEEYVTLKFNNGYQCIRITTKDRCRTKQGNEEYEFTLDEADTVIDLTQ